MTMNTLKVIYVLIIFDSPFILSLKNSENLKGFL